MREGQGKGKNIKGLEPGLGDLYRGPNRVTG